MRPLLVQQDCGGRNHENAAKSPLYRPFGTQPFFRIALRMSITTLPPSASCPTTTPENDMKSTKRALLVALTAMLVGGLAFAQDGTKEETVAMVNAAVEHAKKVGPEQALKDFTHDKGKWNKKDLYIFAFDFTGKNVAHGANEKLVGKDLADMKDPSGRPFVKDMTDIAKSKGSGWYEIDWPHPQTKKVMGKTNFLRRLDGKDAWVAVGYYH